MAVTAVLNVIVHSVIAFHFGAGGVTDAFFMAKDIAEVVTKFFLAGQIPLVFLPILMRYREEHGEDAAWAVCAALFTVTIAVLGAFTVLLFPLVPTIVAVLAPGFVGLAQLLTIRFLRLLLTVGALDVLSGIANAILQSRSQFLLAAVTDLVGAGIFLAILVLGAPVLGWWAMALGAIGGSLGRVALLVVALHRVGMRFRWSFRFDAPTRETARGSLPFLWPRLAGELSSAVYRIVVSGFPAGTLTAITYADKVLKGLFSLIMLPVGTVLFPRLVLAHARGGADEVGQLLRQGIIAVGVLLLPVTAAIVVCGRPLVTILFGRGAFDVTATDFTVVALTLGVLWFYWNGCYSLLSRACFAIRKARVVAVITTCGEVVQAVLYVAFARVLSFVGLVLVPVCYTILLTVAFYGYLLAQLPGLRGTFVNASLIKTVLISMLGGFGGWMVAQILSGVVEGQVGSALWQLLGGGATVVGLILLQARLFGRPGMEEVLGALQVKNGIQG